MNGLTEFTGLLQGHSYPPDEKVRQELISTVRRVIGPIASPDKIHWAPGLPKTRSGKIMRKLAAHNNTALQQHRNGSVLFTDNALSSAPLDACRAVAFWPAVHVSRPCGGGPMITHSKHLSSAQAATPATAV